jgi:putative hemolysin
MSKPVSTKKPSTTQSTPMKDQSGGPNPTQSYCLLRSGTAKKIAKEADGGVGYQVLSDLERQALFIRITSNSGGYFSRELVSIEKITACLSQVAKDATFPTKQLRPAFVGKSTCNAGFLLATLKDMELVSADPAIDGQYAATSDAGWIAWKKSMLAEVVEMIDIEMHSGGPAPLAGNQEQGSID